MHRGGTQEPARLTRGRQGILNDETLSWRKHKPRMHLLRDHDFCYSHYRRRQR